MNPTPEILNSLMEFYHVIQVHEDGSVTEPSGKYAPDVFDGKCYPSTWSLLNGWSGQYGYSGPVMHPSEFIGGAMARYILDTPGYYVAVVCYSDDGDPENWEDGPDVDGWAVATMETEDGE